MFSSVIMINFLMNRFLILEEEEEKLILENS